MKSFFKQMNQVRENGRSSRWENHRDEISKLIEQASGVDCVGKEAIILGAGNCDDLDLPNLTKRFAAITLADIDEDAVKHAVEQLDPLLQKKMKIMNSFDFTLLDQVDFYDRFQSLLDNQVPAIRIVSFFKEITLEVKRKTALTQLKGRYAAVISSAVHTQLFYLHTLSLFAVYAKLYTQSEIKQMMDGVAELRNFLLQKYNELLISLAGRDGTIIVWTDMILLEQQNRFIWDTMYALANEAERIKYMMRLMINYGIEAAVFSIQDMDRRLWGNGKILRSWLWPFNDEKQFITVGIAGRAKTGE